MASELSVDAVRDFIVLNDGKVKNTTLVAHFKKFLNDPQKKSDSRQRFKDCVNTVAVVKTENGEKYVQLKKKYRTAAPITASSSTLPAPEVTDQNSTQASPSHISSFDAPIVPKSEQPVLHGGYSAPITYRDTQEYKNEDSEEYPVLTFGPPDGDQTQQVDPQVSSPEHRKNEPDSSITSNEPPGPSMDSSGVFRVPLPPGDRKSNSETPRRPSQPHLVPNGAVEQARLNFQNNSGEDTSSIMQSEASLDSNKENEFDDDRQGGQFSMDPLEKQWMLMAAKGDMVELRKLLNKDPNLAEKKDFVFGYTALHWAAKKGSVDLVRMFGDTGIDVNSISNGGYTAMHLAAMHGHEKVVQVLVEEYEADAHIRNYSGKQVKDYLQFGAISLSIQKLLFGNDGTGSVRDFAAGLRPRLDSVRKSKRLGNAISGGVGVLGALVRGKSTSSEDVTSISSASPSIGRRGSFKSKVKKKSRKWSKEERPSISIVSSNSANSDEIEAGFVVPRTTSSAHDGMRRGHSSSPSFPRPNSSRDPGHRPRGESSASKTKRYDHGDSDR
ncbi:ankyrin repeat domain-containing protein SOWAHC-like [Styela clava]